MLSNEYVAGFFDGEGSVIMQKNYQVFTVITQSNLELLKGYQRKWGGYIAVQGSKLSPRPCYHWRLSRRSQTVAFLEAIKDYLIVKKMKVKLALEMLNLLQDTGKRKRLANGHYEKSDPAPKQRIYDQFKSL